MEKGLHALASVSAKLPPAWKYLFLNVVYSPFYFAPLFFISAFPLFVVGLKGGGERKEGYIGQALAGWKGDFLTHISPGLEGSQELIHRSLTGWGIYRQRVQWVPRARPVADHSVLPFLNDQVRRARPEVRRV